MLKVEDLAKELKVSQMTIFRALQQGKIKAIKLGNCWRISEEELEKIKKVGY